MQIWNLMHINVKDGMGWIKAMYTKMLHIKDISKVIGMNKQTNFLTRINLRLFKKEEYISESELLFIYLFQNVIGFHFTWFF
jgi:hypothetical protein